MTESTYEGYLFSDLLALARRSWIREVRERLVHEGFQDYRRSDALLVRRLARSSSSLGELALDLSMTRQGARKLVDGLVKRGYVIVGPDEHDARRLNVSLNDLGRAYAASITRTIQTMNEQLAKSCDPDELAAASSVMRLILNSFEPTAPSVSR